MAATIVNGCAAQLLNVDFGPAAVPKSGPAAIGLSGSDFWNPYSIVSTNLVPLRWHDGSASGVQISVQLSSFPLGGVETLQNWDNDEMFQNYFVFHVPDGNPGSLLPIPASEMRFELIGIPAGSYRLYIYAHGKTPEENGHIEAQVGGNSFGIKSTSTSQEWEAPDWIEGNQYVKFESVVVSTGDKLSVISHSGSKGAVINGLQLISANITVLPPAFAESPTNQFVVAGGPLTLSAKVTGSEPIDYQWFKDGAAITGAVSRVYQLPAAAVSDSGAYKIRAHNNAGEDMSAEASVRVIPPLSHRLMNLNFVWVTDPAFYARKTGPAAVGRSDMDYWNEIGPGASQVPLLWSDGATSPATVTTENLYQYGALNSSRDPMFRSYIFPLGATPIRISGLPAGTYTALIYAHGVKPLDRGTVEAKVASHSYGTKSTFGPSDWNKKDWTEGYHYVRFGGILLSPGEDLEFVIKPSSTGPRVINGVQLIYSSLGQAAPRISSQPRGMVENVGTSVRFSISSEGSEPLRFQWRKNGQDIAEGTASTFLIDNVSIDNSGTYSVRIENDFGFAVSDDAVLSVIPPGVLPKLLNVNITDESLAPFHTKVGAAAVGASATDYWNTARGAEFFPAPLSWSDGSPSGIAVSVPSVTTLKIGFNYNPDGMFGGFLSYAPVFEFVGTPAGNYDLLLYGHGPNAADASEFGAYLDDGFLGTMLTSSAPDWDKPDWTEGSHYVRYRNISIGGGQKLTVGGSYFSGMQLVPSDVIYPPVIVEPPLARTAVAGYPLTLAQKTIGTGPFSYQWLKNGVAIEGATAPTLTIDSVTALDAGTYQVHVQNAVIGTNSEPAVVQVIEPISGHLANVNFTLLGSTLFRGEKIGPAAVGKSSGDLWNVYGADTNLATLKWTDGSPSPFTMFVEPITGALYSLSRDPMLQSFIYSSSMGLHLLNLPEGQLSIYVYSHGEYAGEKGDINLALNGSFVARKATSTNADWDKPIWLEGSQYVRFGPLVTHPGDYIDITPQGTTSALRMLNGLQLVYTTNPAPPTIVSAPVPLTAPQGSTNTLRVLAEGSLPLRYQWSKGTQPILGATNQDLVLAPIGFSDAGVYSVRVKNDSGSATSANASVTVTTDHDVPNLTITSPTQGTKDIDLFTLRGAVADANPVSVRWEFNGKAMGSLSVTNGEYFVPGLKFNAGTNHIAVIATDASGNAITAQNDVIYVAPQILVLGAAPQGEGAPIRVSLYGEIGLDYAVEVSGNLQDWTPLGTFHCANGQVEIEDTIAAGEMRFYRAKLQNP